MAILLPKILILHVPKTGTDWVRNAVKVCGPRTEVGPTCKQSGKPWHCTLAEAKVELGAKLPFTATFVRHPLTWYASAWQYWLSDGRFPRFADDPEVEDEDFDKFVNNCLDAKPDGYCLELFERFTGKLGDIDFVGKQESLADDLCRALKLAGQPFDAKALRATPPVNVHGSAPTCGAMYKPKTVLRVLQVERETLQRYRY